MTEKSPTWRFGRLSAGRRAFRAKIGILFVFLIDFFFFHKLHKNLIALIFLNWLFSRLFDQNFNKTFLLSFPFFHKVFSLFCTKSFAFQFFLPILEIHKFFFKYNSIEHFRECTTERSRVQNITVRRLMWIFYSSRAAAQLVLGEFQMYFSRSFDLRLCWEAL